jgi:hypothetical protein
MFLQINLNGNEIRLVLKNGGKMVAESAWTDEYSLSEKLLPNIDALLRKNKISKKDITKVIPRISQTSGVTSSRIIQTVAKAWNAGQRG